MAKGFKHGTGAGNQLNFKVIGGTSEPSNPKENTIWINTSADISSWVFSSTEPTEPVEGMVWLITASSSTNEFNALKKNSIQVYPNSAKQYVSGAWVVKTVMIYKNGAWSSFWNGILYATGDECTSITGGWTIDSQSAKNTSSIRVGPSGAESPFTCQANTKNLINLDSIKTITVNIASAKGSDVGSYAYLRILNSSNEVVNSAEIFKGQVEKSNFTATLDVSALKGNYYIAVVTGHTGSGSRYAYAEFTNVRCTS